MSDFAGWKGEILKQSVKDFSTKDSTGLNQRLPGNQPVVKYLSKNTNLLSPEEGKSRGAPTGEGKLEVRNITSHPLLSNELR